jgi:hypothetical protein
LYIWSRFVLPCLRSRLGT